MKLAPTKTALPALIIAALLIGGCGKPPTFMVSREKLIAEHNANAAGVQKLWARVRLKATFYDEHGLPWSWGSTSSLVAPNAKLLLGKTDRPGEVDFVLIASQAGSELFAIGVSAAEGKYYLWHNAGSRAHAWYGLNALAGAKGIDSLPMDPLQLLAALSITELPDDFRKLPTVVMTTDEDGDRYAYVLTYIDRDPLSGEIGFRRETYFVWDDDQPRRPFMIKFFDHRGRVVMIAHMDDYRQVADSGAGSAHAVMPTDIKVNWPLTGNKVHLTLSQMTARGKGDPAKAASYDNRKPAGIAETQIDRHIANGVPQR